MTPTRRQILFAPPLALAACYVPRRWLEPEEVVRETWAQLLWVEGLNGRVTFTTSGPNGKPISEVFEIPVDTAWERSRVRL